MPDKLTNVTDNNVGKMTDTEIKKALECLEKYTNCGDCAIIKQCKGDCVFTKALNLINRQEEEKQNLKAEVERLREIRDLCNTTILEKNEQIEKLKISDASKEECTIKQHGEIKELKAEVENLKMVLDAVEDHIHPLPFETDFDKAINKAKAEAYKE